MGTLIEEIFSRKAGRPVQVGEILLLDVDYIMSHDNTTPLAIKAFREIGKPILDKNKIVLHLDHVLTVSLDLWATAADGYAVQWMRYANQSDFQDHPSWEPYTTSVGSWTLAAGQNCEMKQVFAQFRDNAAPPQDSPVASDQVFYDNYLAAEMALNEGAFATNRTLVMVNSLDSDSANGCSGLNAMAIWEAGMTQTAWISYFPALYFQLAPQGQVTPTVYATYRDRAGNEGTRSDSILLDLLPPSGTAPLVNNGEPTTHLLVPVSGLSASDTSGIANVWLANSPDGPWAAMAYCGSPPCTYTWNLGDGDGSMTALQKAAQDFDWSPLQPAADVFAAEEIMGNAEEAHKILNGLARGHESTVLYATWGLVKNMFEAVAAQRGLLIISENRYFDLIQESVGRDSKWTGAFRTAWGLDPASSQYPTRGAAALRLYRLSVAMFDALIPEKHRDVVNHTLQIVKDAGYS